MQRNEKSPAQLTYQPMANEKKEQLPLFLIESLYKNCLILEQSNDNLSDSVEVNLQKRDILVIVNAQQPMTEKQNTFLQSILNACKLESSLVNIIHTASSQFGDYKKLSNTFGAKKVLIFGIEPSSISLPMNFPAFQLQVFQKVEYLWSPSLEELETDKAKKLSLWNALQKLFNTNA